MHTFLTPLRRVIAIAAIAICWPAIGFAQTIAAGSMHSVLVKPDGTVWTWGTNSSGQLGDNTLITHSTPGQITLPLGLTALAVAAGSDHTLALASDHTVYAWGLNNSGQIGIGNTTTPQKLPVQVPGLTDVIAIAAGTWHSVALTSDGKVWTWGGNSFGQQGNGLVSGTPTVSPTWVVTGWTASAIAAGHFTTLAIRSSDGTLWGWGQDNQGQLGDGGSTNRPLPVQATGVTGAVAAAGGNVHSVVLLSSGAVLTSGYNLYGQLGDGTMNTRRTMDDVIGLPAGVSVASVSAGYYFTAVRMSNGQVWSFGAGTAGQLGDGSGTTIRSPVQTAIPGTVTQLASGHNHGLAVTSDGIVYTWGQNTNYQLGDGTNANRLTPTAISDVNYEWRVATPKFSVSEGVYYTEQTVVVTDATSDAEIHYTLDGNEPTLADPIIASGASVFIDRVLTLKAKAWKPDWPTSQTASALYSLTVRTPTNSPLGGTYTQPQNVALSTTTAGATIRYTTLAGTTAPPDPTESSSLYTTPLATSTTTSLKARAFRDGWNMSGVLWTTYRMNFGTLAAPTMTPPEGTYSSTVTVTLTAMAGATIRYTNNGSTPTAYSTIYTAPLTISTTQTIKAIALHIDYTTSAVSTAVYTMVVADPVFTPAGGTYPAGQAITVTTATAGATIRYTLNGSDPTDTDPIIASGSSVVAGNYTLKARATKTGCTASAVTTAVYQTSGNLTVASVDGGDDRTVLVRPDGVPWTWGWESGNGSYAGSWVPMPPPGITGAKSVSAGGAHTLIAVADGSVFAWGTNTNGQVGDNSINVRLSPVKLTTITGVAKVAGGASHSLAIKQDGTVWAWGLNSSGQLGDNSNFQRNAPVRVSGLTNVTAVAAGKNFSLALKGDGSVWGWGDNTYGQVGDGTTVTQRKVPVAVTGLTNVVTIAAGDEFALALKGNGSLWTWGRNSSGQLGIGSTTQSLVPVEVTDLAQVSAIAAGWAYALAVTSSGDVWSWGENSSGQLGYSTGGMQTTPAQVPGLTGISIVGAGGRHSLAIGADGSVWSWGYNSSGQLGDETTVNRPAPVPIAGPGYLWKVWSPTLTPASGTYNTVQTATMTSRDAGATLHYTLTGVDPTEADPVIQSGGTLAIDQNVTLKVNAWKPGAPVSEATTRAYELKPLAPSISPATGDFGGPMNATVSDPNTGTEVRYTLDSTDPAVTSPLYSGPIAIDHTLTLKARSVRAGWTPSDAAYASYWITAGTVLAPQVTPGGGTFTQPQLVHIACGTEGATIRYTTDGTDPTESSPLYRFGFMVWSSTTVKARAFKVGLNPSPIAAVTFALDAAGAAATPTIVPAGGRFAVSQIVTVQGPAGATFRYTVDGRDPADTDPAVGPDHTITVGRSEVLKVRAWQDGLAQSAVRSAFFVITGEISAGHAHTLALKSDGTVWSWGYNAFGSLGDGSTTTRDLPVQVVGISDVQAVAAGHYHSLALKRDGTVWAWGLNNCGQLGNGDTGTQTSPVAVTGLTDVVAIAAGGVTDGFIFGHSLALKRDGTVWAWGCNNYRQLGDGTTSPTRTTPVQVVGLRGVTAIFAGTSVSFALEGEGSAGGVVWAWGTGGAGDGSPDARNVPVRVGGIADAVAISNGFALRTDGTLWIWGSTAPEPFPIVKSVYAIDNRGRFALSRDGGRWAWGNGLGGELGNNFVCGWVPDCLAAGRVVPVPSDVQLSSGTLHSVMLRADGTVAATGYNTDGELGNGTRTDTGVPTIVPGLLLADNAWLASDGDNDGLNAWLEWVAGTDPYNRDTNGNGMLDGIEEGTGASGLDPDADGDGFTNWAELLAGTDPYLADTDGDGVLDGADAFPLDPSRSALPPPDPLDTTPPVIILTEPTTARPVGGGGL